MIGPWLAAVGQYGEQSADAVQGFESKRRLKGVKRVKKSSQKC